MIFNDRIGDVAEKYLHKGSKVYLEGALQTRKWTDQSGQEKYSTEVVISKFKGELTMLDGRGDAESGAGQAPRTREYASAPARHAAAAPARSADAWQQPGRDLDDEIPF